MKKHITSRKFIEIIPKAKGRKALNMDNSVQAKRSAGIDGIHPPPPNPEVG
jgi:hypothetical protein